MTVHTAARTAAASIVGAYEHPIRKAPDKSVAQLHAEVAAGALRDAGLSKDDIDGYFCAGDAPGMGPLSMVDYLNLKVRHADSTDIGGASYLAHVDHAAQAIAAGKCDIALITLAGRPRSEGQATGTAPRQRDPRMPDAQWEVPYAMTNVNGYGMCAQRHMHQYGTTSEQLAWIKVAASHHARHNPNAMLKNVVTVQEVLDSPMVAAPLHRLDCCVISDGGGLCNNHPANRGGITKVIEAVRQLRGEAHPAVQVPNCELALAAGNGGVLGSRSGATALIMRRGQ